MSEGKSRDEQFQGFAKALWDELHMLTLEEFSKKNFVDTGLKQQELIARRAYDLVEHVIEHMRPYIYGELVAGQESAADVPDMPELPKEQEG